MELEEGFKVVRNKGNDEESVIGVVIIVIIVKVESNEQKKTRKPKGRQKREINKFGN
jgi:adenosine/AMP kinase